MKDTITLLGSVGLGGNNLASDVALVQAMLSLAKRRQGQFYFTGQINGFFDTRTAVALALFWDEQQFPGEPVVTNSSRALDILGDQAARILSTGSSGPAPYLTFDGHQLCWVGLPHHGKCWHAVSGASGFQSPRYQSLIGKGPIPEGLWRVRQDRYQQYDTIPLIKKLAGYVGRGTWRGGVVSWGRHRIWLHPKQVSDLFGRGADTFTIHGGLFPGSAGCIDLTNAMPDFAEAFVLYGGDMDLVVNYAGWKTAP